jgi:UDP-2-acetamido-2-deoxy-ribo-hexuluronate aminotransferase
MQFIDLKAQQERIRKNIEENIKKVLDHGKYIMGPEIYQLEEMLAQYVGVKYTIGVASGTDALLISLMALGIGPKDAVFTSPFTFIATAEVVKLLGATPVFVDIRPDTFNINPDKLEEAIKLAKQKSLNPRGIIPVDLFGQAADYERIDEIAQKYELFVLQDAAQSFGGSYKGDKTCSNADVAATSFFPAKPLGCYGDGGMIFTNDSELNERLLSIRIHGMGANKNDNIRVGVNGRMDTLQAAILLAKMTIFDEEINLRQEVAKRYSQGLRAPCETPFVESFNVSAWAQYSILHPDRQVVQEALKKENIPSAIYYPTPLHLQQAFIDLGYCQGDFPVSEKIAGEIFSIPMHPYLGEKEQERICNIINDC